MPYFEVHGETVTTTKINNVVSHREFDKGGRRTSTGLIGRQERPPGLRLEIIPKVGLTTRMDGKERILGRNFTLGKDLSSRYVTQNR